MFVLWAAAISLGSTMSSMVTVEPGWPLVLSTAPGVPRVLSDNLMAELAHRQL